MAADMTGLPDPAIKFVYGVSLQMAEWALARQYLVNSQRLPTQLKQFEVRSFPLSRTVGVVSERVTYPIHCEHQGQALLGTTL